jgi:hypothetical protein
MGHFDLVVWDTHVYREAINEGFAACMGFIGLIGVRIIVGESTRISSAACPIRLGDIGEGNNAVTSSADCYALQLCNLQSPNTRVMDCALLFCSCPHKRY